MSEFEERSPGVLSIVPADVEQVLKQTITSAEQAL